jgi:hypothetical protein
MKDTVPATVLGLIGLVLLAGGWVGASGRAALSGQIGFVSLAAAGLVVAGGGAALHISFLTQRLEARSDRFDAVVTAWLRDRAS